MVNGEYLNKDFGFGLLPECELEWRMERICEPTDEDLDALASTLLKELEGNLLSLFKEILPEKKVSQHREIADDVAYWLHRIWEDEDYDIDLLIAPSIPIEEIILRTRKPREYTPRFSAFFGEYYPELDNVTLIKMYDLLKPFGIGFSRIG